MYPDSMICISGDLNCCLLKPDADTAKRVICDFMSDHSLSQCVSSPTYSAGSLLDVFMTNCRNVIRFFRVKFCHFSPHKFIRVFITVPRFKPPTTTVRSRCFNRVDSDSLNFDLSRADWSAVFTSATVTLKWNAFVAIFLPIIDSHAPHRSVRIRNPSAPVVSDSTKALLSRRRGALASFGHRSDQYRDANRAVRSAIRQDTRQDVERRIREGGRQSMWRLIQPIVGSKRAARKLRYVAADLNRFFVGVGPRVAEEVRRLRPAPDDACRLPRVGACSLQLKPLSMAELRAIVLGARRTRTCGADGIGIDMIRACFDSVGMVLLHLVNSSITLPDVPDSWKHSLVHPIHKSGDHSDP